MTLSPTASERQMVGDSKELEKDGWIISSVRTSATGSTIWEKENLEASLALKELDEELVLALKKIAYLSFELKEYKQKEFIGESLDGEVKLNPNLKKTTYYNEFSKVESRVNDIIKLVNEARIFVYDKRIKLLSKEKITEEQMIKKKESIKLSYYSLVEAGEFYEEKKGKWSRKE
jgi:hypothetical protein